ncbi:MAG: TonB-dependent receptor, partial [Sphingomonadales bacterium]|nr:TonB-dependent receptor [Sphingomonadales bacterium]
DADNYTDGSDNEVRTSFRDRAMGVSLDWASEAGGYVRVAYDRNRMADALFPGAGMDSIWSKGDTWRTKGLIPMDNGVVDEARFNVSYARMRHDMNNYTHRTPALMLAETFTLSATWAAELEMDLALDAPTTIAFDVRRNRRDASRYTGMMEDMLTMTSAVVWPDIRTKEYGVAIEQTRALSDDMSVVWGARYDLVRADYHRESELPDMPMMGAMSADMLYQKYYGVNSAPVSEGHLGGLVRLEKVFSNNLSGHLAATRVVRTADATERGLAIPMAMTGPMGTVDASWVGNPAIRPEKHNTLEAALFWQAEKFSFDLTAYADRVDDFILRDSARMQGDVILMAPMVDVYRNVDATLMGIEVSGAYRMSDLARLDASLTYTYGKNRETSNPLPQMPPLQGHLALALEDGPWALTSRAAFAFKQSRVDLNPMLGTGRDANETPGWVSVDVTARYKANDSVDVMLGVLNALDATYAYHLSRANLGDPIEVQVNEPGRSFFVKLVARF